MSKITLQLKTTFCPGFTVRFDITSFSILGVPQVLTGIVRNVKFYNSFKSYFAKCYYSVLCPSGPWLGWVAGGVVEDRLRPSYPEQVVKWEAAWVGRAGQTLRIKYFVICKDFYLCLGITLKPILQVDYVK